jgi:hypothetical protein
MKKAAFVPRGEAEVIHFNGYHYTLEEVFDSLPVWSITTDRNGRKRLITIPVFSENGKHKLIRDYGSIKEDSLYGSWEVSKVIITDLEWKIFLRRPGKVAA